MVLRYAASHYQYRFNRLNYSDFQFWCSIIALLTNYWNAFYFLERVVGSYHKNLLKIAIARKKVEKEVEMKSNKIKPDEEELMDEIEKRKKRKEMKEKNRIGHMVRLVRSVKQQG
jgi:hypothetical protein